MVAFSNIRAFQGKSAGLTRNTVRIWLGIGFWSSVLPSGALALRFSAFCLKFQIELKVPPGRLDHGLRGYGGAPVGKPAGYQEGWHHDHANPDRSGELPERKAPLSQAL
jgi:hypothetical protein